MNIYKINIPKQIILLIVLALILNILRILLFGSLSFIYILWNIFLALLPFIISSILLKQEQENRLSKPVFIIGFIFWLLLLPNAPYLVTDIIHIGEIRKVPVLYDAFLLFNSAWIGMLLGMYSLFHIEKILKFRYSKLITDFSIFAIIILSSFGIYIGRFLRFNSWDIFINHFYILRSVWYSFLESANQLEAYLYTFLFFVFFYVSYSAWKHTQLK